MEPHILTLKYIFKKSGKELPETCVSLEEFFQSGVYFPQFVALIYGLDSLPNTTKTPKNIMAKNINNNTAFEFLASKNSFFKNINSDFTNEKNRVNIIKSIIEKEYFKSTNKDCLNHCNQYLKQNNDSIANFSEFGNIIGFLKLFAAYMKCSVVDILIQYIESFDIPVVISKDSFSANQDILMFQALIILKHLQEGSPSPQQIPLNPITTQQSQNEEVSLPSKVETKRQLSTDSNLIFEIPPDTSSDDKIQNSNEKELELDTDIQKDTVSTKTITEVKKNFLTDSNVICDIPLKEIFNEPKNDKNPEQSDSEDEEEDLNESHKKEVEDLNKSHKKQVEDLNISHTKKVEDLNESHKKAVESLNKSHQKQVEDLNESHKKEVEDLNKLVNELNHQKDELKQSLQHQCEEKKRLNNVVVEQETKLKNTSNTISNLNKQVANLNSNLEKLGQSKKALEENKKQEIEKLNKTNTILDENFKNLKKISENQKATSSAEIMNLKKQLADLNKQKEVTESELKKQIIDLNKRKEMTETELKKQIRNLEAKLPDKTTRQSISNEKNDSARPISQLIQPIYKERSIDQQNNNKPKVEQKQPTQENQNKEDKDKDANTNPQRSYQSSPFFLSLPGLMNFL